MALVVLAVILGICPTSEGLLLVYKVSSSVKGVEGNSGQVIKAPIKGYLVFSADEEGYCQDANLVIYGTDAEQAKVYFKLNYSDSDGLLDVGLLAKGDPVLYFFIALAAMGEDNPFAFESCVWGKMAPKDIGFGREHMWLVPVSLKGNITVWLKMLFDADQDITATGAISIKLDKLTNNFNMAGWSQDEAIEYITSQLQRTGYSQGVKAKGKTEVKNAKSEIPAYQLPGQRGRALLMTDY
jgi:hypothetical protein